MAFVPAALSRVSLWIYGTGLWNKSMLKKQTNKKTMEMGRPIVAILRMQNSDLTISNNMLWPRMAQIARQHLFAHRNMENIPPSEAAPLQNVLRAVYQAGYLWGLDTRIKSPVFPSANDWRWLGDGSSAHPYMLNWTMLPQASKVCKEYSQEHYQNAWPKPQRPAPIATRRLFCELQWIFTEHLLKMLWLLEFLCSIV